MKNIIKKLEVLKEHIKVIIIVDKENNQDDRFIKKFGLLPFD